MQFKLLHRNLDRLAQYASLDAIAWSDDLSSWVCADPKTVRSLLRLSELRVIDFRNVYGTLTKKLDLDFSPTTKVLDFVALGLNGQEHREVRKDETLYLKEVASLAVEAFDASIAGSLQSLMDGRSKICLAQEVVSPAVAKMFFVISGIEAFAKEEPSLSLIFDRMLSLNRRRKINSRINELLAKLEQSESGKDASMRVSLQVVGADSIFGALTQSLAIILEHNEGRMLSEIDWPCEVPETAVPYVDRIATTDFELGGANVKAGDRVRIYVQALKNDPNMAPAELFGIGAHICLGKAISMRTWKSLTLRLSRIDTKLNVVEHSMRRPDFLFNAPSSLKVSISHV
jgi:hypothetical protein